MQKTLCLVLFIATSVFVMVAPIFAFTELFGRNVHQITSVLDAKRLAFDHCIICVDIKDQPVSNDSFLQKPHEPSNDTYQIDVPCTMLSSDTQDVIGSSVDVCYRYLGDPSPRLYDSLDISTDSCTSVSYSTSVRLIQIWSIILVSYAICLFKSETRAMISRLAD